MTVILLAFAFTAFLAACLVLAKRFYTLPTVFTVTTSIDVILLLYIMLQSFSSRGFEPFLIVNFLFHIWLTVLSMRLRRSAEALEVLPDHYVEEDDGRSPIEL